MARHRLTSTSAKNQCLLAGSRGCKCHCRETSIMGNLGVQKIYNHRLIFRSCKGRTRLVSSCTEKNNVAKNKLINIFKYISQKVKTKYKSSTSQHGWKSPLSVVLGVQNIYDHRLIFRSCKGRRLVSSCTEKHFNVAKNRLINIYLNTCLKNKIHCYYPCVSMHGRKIHYH